MAKSDTQKTKVSGRGVRSKKASVSWNIPWNKRNFMILGAGLVVILIGFALMATGITEDPAVPDGTWNNPMAVSIAPLLLVIGYCVIIPYGIIKFFGKEKSESE